MNNFYLVLIVLAISNNILAQNSPSVISVIGAQGGIDRTEFITLEWTLGENFVETVNFEDEIYTQGFHQSFFIIEENLITPLGFNKFILYPNPVTSDLTIYLNSKLTSNFHLSIYSIQGSFIRQSFEHLQNSRIVINLEDLSSGVYILHINDENGTLIEKHQIIKK